MVPAERKYKLKKSNPKYTYSLRNVHRLFNKGRRNGSKVSIKDFIDITTSYALFMVDKVLEGYQVNFPQNMGYLTVTGKKRLARFTEDGQIRGLAPDWKKTKELWNERPDLKAKKQLVYCTNEHTNGFVYKYFWNKERAAIEDKAFYSFRLSKPNKQKLHNKAMEGMEYTEGRTYTNNKNAKI